MSTTKEKAVIGITFVLVLIYAESISAYVIMKLWAWLISPVFDVPVLPFFYAMGLGIFRSYLKGNSTITKKQNKNYRKFAFKAVIAILARAILFLTLGYFTNQLIKL